MAIREFHCSSLIGKLAIPQEGGEESGDKGELMRSCSGDRRTKVQPCAPYFSIHKSSPRDDAETKVQLH